MACYFCVDVYFNKDNERNEYISIMHKRTSTVDARAVVINEEIL